MDLTYDVKMKHCGRGKDCVNPKGSFLPINEFSIDNSSKSGYQSWCNFCLSQYNKQYKQKNKEQISEYNKQYDQRLKVVSPKIWNGSGNKLYLGNYLNKNLGVVYFIGDTNLTYVKIGLVKSLFNLSKRYQAIQGCCPLTLKLHGFIQTANSKKTEIELHEKFKQYKKYPTVTNGHEWFFYTPEIMRYVETNCLKIELANTLLGETYIDLAAFF